jgi:hypothetical protein
MTTSPDDLQRLNRLNRNGQNLLAMSLQLVDLPVPAAMLDGRTAIQTLVSTQWWAGGNFDEAFRGIPSLGEAGLENGYRRSVEETCNLFVDSREVYKLLEGWNERMRMFLGNFSQGNNFSFVIWLRMKLEVAWKQGWIFRAAFPQIVSRAKRNGASSGQHREDEWGNPLRSMNSDAVVDLLVNADRSRSFGLSASSRNLLERMARASWHVTCPPHRSISDDDPHVTIWIPEIDGQYHLRLDGNGFICSITHLDEAFLSDKKGYQGPGA